MSSKQKVLVLLSQQLYRAFYQTATDQGIEGEDTGISTKACSGPLSMKGNPIQKEKIKISEREGQV